MVKNSRRTEYGIYRLPHGSIKDYMYNLIAYSRVSEAVFDHNEEAGPEVNAEKIDSVSCHQKAGQGNNRACRDTF
jgi:hypothetical protein